MGKYIKKGTEQKVFKSKTSTFENKKVANQSKYISTKYYSNTNQKTEQRNKAISYKCIHKHC